MVTLIWLLSDCLLENIQTSSSALDLQFDGARTEFEQLGKRKTILSEALESQY